MDRSVRVSGRVRKVVWLLSSAELVLAVSTWVVVSLGIGTGVAAGYLILANVLASFLAIFMMAGNLLIYRYTSILPNRDHRILAVSFPLPFSAALIVLNVYVSRSLTPHSTTSLKVAAAVLTLSTVVVIAWTLITYLNRSAPRIRAAGNHIAYRDS